MADSRREIYLDYQASTPVDPRVAELVADCFREPGNPASAQHAFGRRRSSQIELARERVASLIGAQSREIIFTSGATEANNLGLLGFGLKHREAGLLVTTSVEHPSITEVTGRLRLQGWDILSLPVDASGNLEMAALSKAMDLRPTLVSVMAANNEIGALNRLTQIGALAKEVGSIFHTDATQALGDIKIDVRSMNIDLLSLSGHKIYGPSGTGALFVRHEVQDAVEAQILGGGQERRLRSGTPNTWGVAGLGLACQLLEQQRTEDRSRIRSLRDKLAKRMTELVPDMRFNGPDPVDRLAGNLHVTFFGADAEAVMANCPNIAMASGSACASSSPAPSHVLDAMAMSPAEAECSLRISVGRFTATDELEDAAESIAEAVRFVRSVSETATGGKAAVRR